MNAFWNFESAVSFNEVRESHLHDSYPVTYQDGEIDDMLFWPLPPEFSYVSDSSWLSNGDHACGDTEPRR